MNKLFSALILLLAFPVIAADAPTCKLVSVASWHVRFQGTQPIVDGYINGKKIGVLVDTGAYSSFLTRSAAQRLGLPTHSTGQKLQGLGTGESSVFQTLVEELRIGDFSIKDLRVRVAGQYVLPGTDFVLGQDLLQNVDTEFDYAHGAIRLYQPLDCKGKTLAYWDPSAQALPLSGDREDIIPVIVNGRKADAAIDSGAYASIVQLGFAEHVGITPSSRGVQPSSCAIGVGNGVVRLWVAPFDSIQVGEEVIRDAHVRIGERVSDAAYYRAGAADMMLGGDFLKTHRVLIAHSQGKAYFTYSGGQVFAATPALDCWDARVAGKNAKEALAIYDDILAKDPGDVKALLQRADLRHASRDLAGALADLDAAIRVDPANPLAFTLRSSLRRELGDYSGALADSDVAIANGMGTAGVHAYRAELRRAMGDRAGMMAEIDEALKLDPHHLGALRVRSRFRYFNENYAAAAADLTDVLALRPNGLDSIWLYLTRLRQGDARSEPLESGLAQLKGSEWPAPVMQYLLDRIDRDALMKAAATDEKERKGRECEANYYSAERLVISGKKDEARPLLEAARSNCPTNYTEYEAANIEIERIK